jgi:hypothetical protein
VTRNGRGDVRREEDRITQDDRMRSEQDRMRLERKGQDAIIKGQDELRREANGSKYDRMRSERTG